ncbi:hypothetical protein GW916_10515 [bacterium]|nr:hypothetical protein [bacterium]
MEKYKVLRTFGASQAVLFSVIALTLSACINDAALTGGGVASNNSTGDFQGCISGEAVNTQTIQVSYEWPSGASSVSILRNGISVFSSVSGVGGIYNDVGLLEGQSYSYSCTAQFSNGTKYGTKVLNLSTLVVNAPTFQGISSISATGSNSVRVTWPVAYGVPTANYVVVAKLGSAPTSTDFDTENSTTQSLTSQGKIKRVVVNSPSSTQTIISGIGDELEYHYAVEACSSSNICSMGDGSNDTLAKTLDDAGAPTTSGVSFAQIVNSKVVLTVPWTPSNGKVAVRRVYRNTTGGTNILNYTNVQSYPVTDPANPPTELTLTGSIAESTTYYFIVRDEDDQAPANKNTNTQTQSVDTGDLTPPPLFAGICTGVSATCPNGASSSDAQGDITVRWAAPSDWSDYKGFKIYTVGSDNSLSFIKDCICTSDNCVSNPLQECSINGLDAYRTYKIHVRAFDASGNITTYLDPTFNFSAIRTTDTTAPIFSSGLASVYSNGVALSWDSASDNQYSSEPGATINYQVWRKTGSTFATPTNPDTEADGSAPLATQTTRTYTDSSVLEGDTYYYTVCALDSSGNRTCDGNVESRFIDDVTDPTISISDNKTSTGKVWNLSFTISDNSTDAGSISVAVRRKVAATSNDFPILSDSVLTASAGLSELTNEGSPEISGTEGVNRYVNYLVTVTDLAGNSASETHSVHLDNAPPSSNPVLVSFSPLPTFGSTSPTVRGNLSANSSTVDLYLTSDCSGAAAASGSKASFESTGLMITVPSSDTNAVYARASTSAATNGNCVLLGNFDNIAPTLASVTVNGPSSRGNADPDWSLSFGTHSSDMIAYCIRRNSTSVAGCASSSSSSSGWVTATSLPNSFTVSITSDGDYALSVFIKDASENVSNVVTSNVITVDATRPAWGTSLTVPDWTTSPNSLGSVSVGALDAADSNGIDRYEWAVGTGTKDGSGNCNASCSNMKSWTVFSTPSFTPTALLTMSHGTTYYVNVRALDGAGNYTVLGDTFTADFIPPADPEFSNPSSNGQFIIITAGGLFTYTGACEAGSTLHVTPGTGVNVQGTPTCAGDGTFSFQAGIIGLNFSTPTIREITLQSEKSSGLTSGSVLRSMNATGVCPTNYVGVPGNPTYGTSDFCVAKFEMKAVTANPTTGSATLANVNGNIAHNTSWFPDSRPDGTPFVNTNQRQAVLMCDKLNTVADGTGPYQLMTNAQWQTMAVNIENVASNWSGASPAVGVGQIARGHTDNAVSDPNHNSSTQGIAFTGHNALAAASTDNTTVAWNFASNTEEFEAGYRGTGQNSGLSAGSGWEQRRTQYLSNGEVVWDVAGNVWEWVRFTESAGALDSGIADNDSTHYNSRLLPTQPSMTGWQELNNTNVFSDLGGTGSLLSHWFSSSGTYSPNPSTFSLGRIYTSSGNTGNAVLRGAQGTSTVYDVNGGVFSTSLYDGPTGTANSLGFRCAVSP